MGVSQQQAENILLLVWHREAAQHLTTHRLHLKSKNIRRAEVDTNDLSGLVMKPRPKVARRSCSPWGAPSHERTLPVTYNAAISGSTATITVTTTANSTTLKVVNAASLGDQLTAFVTDPSADPVDQSPDYMVYPTDSGVRVTSGPGQVDIPWRWIMPIASQLNA